MKRKVFEHYQPYKIKQKARFDLGNNENRIIDWAFATRDLGKFGCQSIKFYGDNTYSELIEICGLSWSESQTSDGRCGL